MTNGKAKGAADERREPALTPVPETRSLAESDELYYVTPQATGQSEKQAVNSNNEPKTLEELRTAWEPHLGPVAHESVGTSAEMRNPVDEAAYRSQAARQDAPHHPPKTPVDEEPAKTVTFQDEKQPSILPRRPTTEDDETPATQLQAEEDGVTAAQQAEVPPGLSAPHISFAPNSGTETQIFTLSWRRPLTDYASLTITPNADSSSHWRLNYQTKYFATLHRYQATQARVDGDFPARQVAEMKFPGFIWPGCGPTIKLEPYDEAVGPRRADVFMKCTGWLTTRYAIDVPVLDGARCTWRTLRPAKKDATATDDQVSLQPDSDVDGRVTLSSSSPAYSTTTGEPKTAGDLISQAKTLINDDTWTPYPPHHLIMGTSPNSGRIIATYTRLAPWNKNAGTLSINTDQSTSPEYIEGIIIACAAMVGMQDRMGLASSLMEASTESIMARKKDGNGAGLKPAKIRPYVRGLQKSNTAPAEGEGQPKQEAVAKPKRSGSVQKGLKRLSMQARELVPKSAGSGPASETTKMDKKAEVAVAA